MSCVVWGTTCVVYTRLLCSLAVLLSSNLHPSPFSLRVSVRGH